jgi:SAM-dependent methyltransferase
MRAAVHLLEKMNGLDRDCAIFMTEQTTPLFHCVRTRFPHTTGSEFIDASASLGAVNGAGVRNEDLTQLTFASGQFDWVLCFEVFEHIPQFQRAFAECARILKPGGRMLFSTPFDAMSASNVIRARMRADGQIDYLLPPEYHGDPIRAKGILAFQVFGWEMLTQVCDAGFSSASALLYRSRDFGYLGGKQIQFLATK